MTSSRSAARNWIVALAFEGYNSFFTRVPWGWARRWYLSRILGIRLGRGAAIHMGCFFTGRNIEIGERSVVNRRCTLDGRAGLRIGADVSVSPECMLLSLDHDPRDPDFATRPRSVVVGDRVWLGARATILPGVEMGEGSVAAAGAVVAKSCPPYAIVAGVPARTIGERPRGLRYRLDYHPLFGTDILP